MTAPTNPARRALTLAAIALGTLSLAACQPEEPEFEADAEDLGGGELIVEPADQEGVAVDLPEAEMTSVPEGEMAPPDEMAE